MIIGPQEGGKIQISIIPAVISQYVKDIRGGHQQEWHEGKPFEGLFLMIQEIEKGADIEQIIESVRWNRPSHVVKQGNGISKTRDDKDDEASNEEARPHDEEAEQVFFGVLALPQSLSQKKNENRKGNAADAAESESDVAPKAPACIKRAQKEANMVESHRDKADDFEPKGR